VSARASTRGNYSPLILVGHSTAAYVVRLHAAAYPQHVAGLVLVDPAFESLADNARTSRTTKRSVSTQAAILNDPHGRLFD
jgi:pimeloyl-ACP methyl ester carboxylesterase